MPNSHSGFNWDFFDMAFILILLLLILTSLGREGLRRRDIAAMQYGYVQDKEGYWVKDK
jgi:hypothetical protein